MITITFDLALGVARGNELVGATADAFALLFGRHILAPGHRWNAVLGLALDFDFFHSVLVNFGQSAVGLMLLAERPLSLFGGRWTLESKLYAAPTFSAISSDYPGIREYNLGPGATLKAHISARRTGVGELYVKIDRYWVNTWSGNAGNEFAGVIDIGGSIEVVDRLGVGFHYLLSDKSGRYRDFENTSDTIHLGEAFLSYRLGRRAR